MKNIFMTNKIDDLKPIQRKLEEIFKDTLLCGRVWSAWSYGTMTGKDFSPTIEDNSWAIEAVIDVYNAIIYEENLDETKIENIILDISEELYFCDKDLSETLVEDDFILVTEADEFIHEATSKLNQFINDYKKTLNSKKSLKIK